jgi:hypothetical protein
MDRDYAELSLKVGMFAGAADNYLGGTLFLFRVREHRWDLTPEMLDGWKQEAVGLGVPAERLELTAQDKAKLPEWVTAGMNMQRAVDDGKTIIMMGTIQDDNT